MRKYNPNTWSEKGSDTVGCHYHLNLSGFTIEPWFGVIVKEALLQVISEISELAELF